MQESEEIQYSDKCYDDTYEYRYVIMPPKIVRRLPPQRLLREQEWREVGVQGGSGWEHYAIHLPEPHVLLLRRPLQQKAKKAKHTNDRHLSNGRLV